MRDQFHAAAGRIGNSRAEKFAISKEWACSTKHLHAFSSHSVFHFSFCSPQHGVEFVRSVRVKLPLFQKTPAVRWLTQRNTSSRELAQLSVSSLWLSSPTYHVTIRFQKIGQLWTARVESSWFLIFY